MYHRNSNYSGKPQIQNSDIAAIKAALSKIFPLKGLNGNNWPR